VNLPGFYHLEDQKDGSRLLWEDTPIFRSAHTGADPIKEADYRGVALFPKGSRVRDIEEIARLDNESRNPKVSDADRRNAMWELAEKFGA
jgi:hypothetical protein